MSEDLPAPQDDVVLNEDLNKLGREAKEAHELAKEFAIEAVANIVRSGQALCKARDMCNTPQWDCFLAIHFDRSERTAQRYMRLARNWEQLRAIAPPEALTSQRQVFKLLDALLVGDRPPSEASGRGRKKRASSAVPALPAPAFPEPAEPSPPTVTAADEWRLTAKKLHVRTLRLLEQLTSELRVLTPPHYLVRNALDSIDRAYRHFSDEGQMLFRADASSSAPRGEPDAGIPN